MTVYLTPTDDGEVIDLSSGSRRFKKKILPKSKIVYGDREIVFDDEYLTDLAQSYNDTAYDQVPFQLADESNRHTMLPERMKGECLGVEVKEDGLYGTFELSSDAADLVRANPKLGVSARIVEGYKRSDGKTFKRALQHVLGTLDPRIPGMGAWEEIEEVDLSNEGSYTASEVVDLSNYDYEEEGTVSKNSKETVPVSDEAAIAAIKQSFPDWSEKEIRELLAEPLTDEELAAAEAELEAEKAEEPKTEEEPKAEDKPEEPKAETPAKEPALSLSNEVVGTPSPDPTVVDLAAQMDTLKADLAKERFSKERAEWVRAGVPPKLIDLAADVLTAPQGAVIDLSNGVETSQVDAADVIRKLLTQSAGYIELASERGHTLSLSNEDGDEAVERDNFISMWREADKLNNPHNR